MLSRLLRKFGYMPEEEVTKIRIELGKSIDNRIKLQSKLVDTQKVAEEFEESYLTSKKRLDTIEIDIRNVEPEGEKRLSYVARVAELHNDILRPKLEYLISDYHNALEPASNTERYDGAVKGAIVAFRELIDWGDMMTNEHRANILEAREEEGITTDEK